MTRKEVFCIKLKETRQKETHSKKERGFSLLKKENSGLFHYSDRAITTMAFTATGVDLEIIILSDVSQTVRDKHHMISLRCGI